MDNLACFIAIGLARYLMALSLCVCGLIAALPIKVIEMPHNAERTTIESAPPHWDKGYLVGFNRGLATMPPKVWMQDAEGKSIIDGAAVWFPEAEHVTLHSVAVSNDHALLISAEMWNTGGEMARVLCHMIPPGIIDQVIRTDGFLAEALLIGHNGVISALGNKNIDVGNDYDALEVFDSAGHVLRTNIRRSEFNPNLDPRTIGPFGWLGPLGQASIASSRDSVGVFLPEEKTWIEFDDDEKQINKFTVEPPALRHDNKGEAIYYKAAEIGMTQSGRVYALFYNRLAQSKAGAPPAGLYQLDRIQHRWVAVPDSFHERDYIARIYGVDGEMLILRSGCCEYGWFQVPDMLKPSR
jgi:hypothetical protein